MSETLEAIGDRVSPERMVERRKAAVGQRFKRARDAIMGSRDYEEPKLTRVRERAGDAVSATAERVQHAPEVAAEQVRGNPIAAGLLIFGAGVLVASIFPETQTEQRLVEAAQPQMQRATEDLKDAGHELVESATQHGQEAAHELRAAGTEAAGTVTDQARASAEQIKQGFSG